MAATGVSSVKSEKISRGFRESLASAVFEWLLLLLLFINALFSYLVTKFARYCALDTPCLLCSRLDHVLGNAKLGFYWDMICKNHKFEISSLVLCHAHSNLVDVHGMCENCLFSFATINKSNAETYRLLVGKMGEDSGSDEESLPDCRKSNTKLCSCCKEPWASRGHAKKLLHTTSIVSQLAELDDPLGVIGHVQDSLKNIGGASHRDFHQRNRGIDTLSHVGYTELKINSDTESDGLFSDDDETGVLISNRMGSKEDVSIDRLKKEPLLVSQDKTTSVQLVKEASAQTYLHSLPEAKANVVEAVLGETAVAYGLEEINSPTSEIKPASPPVAELFALDDFPSLANDSRTVKKLSSESCVTESNGSAEIAGTTSKGMFKVETEPISTTEKSMEGNHISTDSSPKVSSMLDLGDAYKLAVGNRGRQLSGVLTEQWLAKDSSRVSEDLKTLLSQLSATRPFERSVSDLSPKVSLNIDEVRTSDSSNSHGLHNLQKRISLERNESGLSMDGSIVSEIEGESVVDRLKRQIEHDRKSMSALYKELEEERNASAIAANQAMAMITRLQEEKAALQMEALQYLRMMEEQAEYDMEALQKTNDLLAEREKDIQDLEAELEFYRGNINDSENMAGPTDSVGRSQFSENVGMQLQETNMGNINDSLLCIEDERLHILECLKKLEEKPPVSSSANVDTDLVNGERHNDSGGVPENDVSLSNNRHSDSDHSEKIPSSVSEGVDLASLNKEVSYLRSRLEALDTDRSFLERAIRYLRIGDEGLLFIQDIASHLQEMRSNRLKADQMLHEVSCQ